jgi:hypothetical protein
MSVRILTGRLKGRRLFVPPGKEIRPTSERAREALFDILAHGTPRLVGARFLDLEGAATDSNSEFGWAIHASSVILTFGKDSLQLNFTFGDGIGRYILTGVGNDGFVDASGRFETIEAYGLTVGYTRQWSEHWQSNLV